MPRKGSSKHSSSRRCNMNYVYDSTSSRAPAIAELFELWRYRDLLRLLVINSIKTRYRRSLLGVVWTLLNPLMMTLVLTIAFTTIMRFDVKTYPVYLLSGLISWNFFSQTTLQTNNTLVWGSGLLKRVYIPRTIFAVSVLGNGLMNFTLALFPLTIVMLIFGHPLKVTLLLLPIPLLFTAMFTLGVALMVSTLSVFYTDVVDIYNIFLSIWFYLTPVFYPISILPPRVAAILKWNPMSQLLELFRALIYYGEFPSLSSIAITGAFSVLFLTIGWLVFTKRMDDLAYRI